MGEEEVEEEEEEEGGKEGEEEEEEERVPQVPIINRANPPNDGKYLLHPNKVVLEQEVEEDANLGGESTSSRGRVRRKRRRRD